MTDVETRTISVTNEDGEKVTELTVSADAEVSQTEDGAITSIVSKNDEWEIFIDENTEFGAKVYRLAEECGQTAEEYVKDAVRYRVSETTEPSANHGAIE